ncbi:MAG: diguanylate cyclase [Candidatus Poribacteria bacterium]|nr:diguanylate cyclase [Candidatus Poribacteria bacterium]
MPLLALSFSIFGRFVGTIKSWLVESQFSWIDLFAVSFALSLLFTPLIARLAKRVGAIDLPKQHGIHESPTPLWGGLAIYAAFTITLLINYEYSIELKGVAMGATIILVIGLIDDFRELSAQLRLAGQLLAVGVVIAFGVRLDVVPFFETAIGDMLLTAFWIVGITNAMNFLDGMDGLVTGCAAIQAILLSIFALQTGQQYLGYLAIALAGSCLGFLPYNFPPFKPASIFLGDTGSTFLGFTIASLAVMSDWAENSPIKAFSAPLLITGVLTFDMAYTTIARVATGKVATLKELMDYVGKDHIHHRIHAIGFSRRQTVLLIYVINICFGIGALVLLNARAIDAILLVTQAAAIAVIISGLETLGRKRISDLSTDDLTQLYTGRYSRQCLSQEVARARRYERGLSLLYFEIDDFKQIATVHGRLVADSILKEIATLIVNACRVSDVVCRYGDTEFAVILPETDPVGAEVIAERIRQEVEAHTFDSDLPRLRMTISVGLAGHDTVRPGHEPEDFIQFANQALERAKSEGKNRVVSIAHPPPENH